MSDATSADVPQLERIMKHVREITDRVWTDKLDMVEYGLALAVASRAVFRTIPKFEGTDFERYQHLSAVLQEMGDM